MNSDTHLNNLVVSLLAIIVGASMVVTALIGLSRTNSAGSAQSPSSTRTAPNQASSAAPSGEAAGEGQNTPETTPEAPNSQVRTYTAEVLGNMELEIGPWCYSFVAKTGADKHVGKLTFSGGVARSPKDQYAEAAIKEARPIELAGQTYTAVLIQCYGGGSYSYDALQIHDQDAKLVGQLETWAHDVDYYENMYIFEHEIKEYSFEGDKLRITMPGLVLAGDENVHAASHSGVAHLTLKWDGARFIKDDLYISTPFGDVKEPNLADVQAFYTNLQTGNDAAAAPYTTPEIMDLVANGCMGAMCGNGVSNYREKVLRTNSYVEACALAGPGENYFTTPNGEKRYIGGGPKESSGYFFCGVRYPDSSPSYHLDEYEAYSFYLIVRSPKDGDFFVEQMVTMFG